MKKINMLLVISIILIIWIDYTPLKLPSLVTNPDKLEILIYNLSLAYIASYIFYYINNYLPEKKNSKIIKKIVNNNVLDIIQYTKILIHLKGNDFGTNRNLIFRGKEILIDDFLKKVQKDLQFNTDTIILIKERLPTEFLNYTLLLKHHPYFNGTFSELEKFHKYADSYDLLSNKLYIEFKKL